MNWNESESEIRKWNDGIDKNNISFNVKEPWKNI